MTTERMSYMIGVMQASQGGQEIEMHVNPYDTGDWLESVDPQWNWETNTYRIKPPPPPEPREFWIHPEKSNKPIKKDSRNVVFCPVEPGWIRVREVLTKE